MAKPICVIKVDNSNGEFSSIYDIQEALEAKLNDYHVMTVPFNHPEATEAYEPIQVQVFHEKDFSEAEFSEIKNMISEAIKSLDNAK